MQILETFNPLKALQKIGQKIELKGWVQKKRSSGKVKFLLLRSGESFFQCVLSKSTCEPSSFELFSNLNQETLVSVKGEVREEKRSPGGFEINVFQLNLLSDSKNYPISPKEHGIDFLMSHRHLWIRSQRQVTLLRIRHEFIMALHEFFNQKGFTLTEAPIFTGSSCEGTSTLFKTKYFQEKTAYLSQSGQLYMEALAAALGKVYCLGPIFRAEKSKTRRHLIEFWCVEPEIAFANLNDAMNLSEELIIFLIQKILKNKRKELLSLNRDITLLEKIKAPFPRLHYEEALDLLKNKNESSVFRESFGIHEEAFLSSQFHLPLFIHHFPKNQKAFYMKEDPQSPKHCLSFDLLAPESYGEIIGGGQREDELSKLQKGIKEHNLNEKDFQWYLDLRRYGSFIHSGFGLGIERSLSWICGLPHVRETIPFGRLYDRLYP